MDDNNVLLKVEHLCQYFKAGSQVLKAVDDVSFEIKKGEVFGLVGESGCGKTTTGRSIIRLYDATGGSVYFDGKRICAGTGSYKEKAAAARAECKRVEAEIKKRYADDKAQREQELAAARERCAAVLREQSEHIK